MAHIPKLLSLGKQTSCKQSMTTMCIVCAGPGGKTCPWCQVPVYCGKKCQKIHWLCEHREHHYGSEPDLQVSVSKLSGRGHQIVIAKRARISDLKRIIANKMSIPKKKQVLICGEVILSNPKLRMQQVAEDSNTLPGGTVQITVAVKADDGSCSAGPRALEDDGSDRGDLPALIDDSDSSDD